MFSWNQLYWEYGCRRKILWRMEFIEWGGGTRGLSMESIESLQSVTGIWMAVEKEMWEDVDTQTDFETLLLTESKKFPWGKETSPFHTTQLPPKPKAIPVIPGFPFIRSKVGLFPDLFGNLVTISYLHCSYNKMYSDFCDNSTYSKICCFFFCSICPSFGNSTLIFLQSVTLTSLSSGVDTNSYLQWLAYDSGLASEHIPFPGPC